MITGEWYALYGAPFPRRRHFVPAAQGQTDRVVTACGTWVYVRPVERKRDHRKPMCEVCARIVLGCGGWEEGHVAMEGLR